MSHDQHELAPTRVEVSDLIDSPGASREVGLDVARPEGFEVPLNTFGDVVSVDGVLESLVDGVLLRGTVAVGITQTCARCLQPITPGTLTAHVAELFSDSKAAEVDSDVEEGYEIANGMIDIDALIRDALAEQVPVAPHCRPDCAGLCPTCGVDRNTTTCDCTDVPVDGRWSALSDLKLNP